VVVGCIREEQCVTDHGITTGEHGHRRRRVLQRDGEALPLSKGQLEIIHGGVEEDLGFDNRNDRPGGVLARRDQEHTEAAEDCYRESSRAWSKPIKYLVHDRQFIGG